MSNMYMYEYMYMSVPKLSGQIKVFSIIPWVTTNMFYHVKVGLRSLVFRLSVYVCLAL